MTIGKFVVGCIAVVGVMHGITAGMGFLLGRPQWEYWIILSLSLLAAAAIGAAVVAITTPHEDDDDEDDGPPKNVSLTTVES